MHNHELRAALAALGIDTPLYAVRPEAGGWRLTTAYADYFWRDAATQPAIEAAPVNPPATRRRRRTP